MHLSLYHDMGAQGEVGEKERFHHVFRHHTPSGHLTILVTTIRRVVTAARDGDVFHEYVVPARIRLAQYRCQRYFSLHWPTPKPCAGRDKESLMSVFLDTAPSPSSKAQVEDGHVSRVFS